jgi:hypothetical protein
VNVIGLIKTCLNKTYSKFRIRKNLPDKCPIQNGLKQGDGLSPFLFNFASEYATRKVEIHKLVYAAMSVCWART